MSAFIVISTSDKLNWIVDGIVKCRPQNPNTLTYIATGKICRREDALYYDHTYSIDSTNSSDLAEELTSLLANQMAQFRKATRLQDELQIFTLENPIDSENCCCCKMVYEALNEAVTKRSETNCHITRILFSYDISSPCNVVTQVSSSILSDYLAIAKNSEYATTKVCYIDNQDRCCAGIATSKEKHDLMIPRMLADLMMLISSRNSACNVRNAIVNEKNVFSVGYAECMYYFDDVKRYYEYAYNAEMRSQILYHENEDNSLDYILHPLGISHRIKRLYPIYRDVPFSEDIYSDFVNQSNDKKIDDIVRSVKQQIVNIKKKAMSEAIEEDERLTLKRRNEAELEGMADTEMLVVTQNQDRVRNEYPDYIDRKEIYNHWLIASSGEDSFDDVATCVGLRNNYYDLLEFIKTPNFKSYILDSLEELSQDNKNEPKDDNTSQKKNRNGCNFFAKLFGNTKNQPEELTLQTTITSSVDLDPHSIIKSLKEITFLQNSKNKYKELCSFEEKISKELETYLLLQDKFELTSHAASYNNLIDRDILVKVQGNSVDMHINNVIQKWLSLSEDKQNLEQLYVEMKKECESELKPYHFINWESPAPFIKKDVDIEKLSQTLLHCSLPFVNSVTHTATRENLTSVYFYFDRAEWKNKIEAQQIQLPSDTMYQQSAHIESKFSVFQILQWEDNIVSGLADIHQCDS